MTEAQAAATMWFKDAGYGVMLHWTTQSRPASGGEPLPYAQAVAAFDVELCARQLHAAGAGYLIFTISHAEQYLACPSAVLDAVLPGRTCARDLYADLLAALQPYGIKLVFYSPSIATREDLAWASASGFDTSRARFAQLQYDLVEELGLRYGTQLAGWWIDNCHDGGVAHPRTGEIVRNQYDYAVYADKLRAGNPQRIVAFNLRGVDAWESATAAGVQDYQAGESDALDRTPADRFAGEGGAQWHILVWMDDFWVHTQPAPPMPRYSDDAVIRFVRAVISAGGVFTYNAAPLQDTLIADATLAQLRALKAAIR